MTDRLYKLLPAIYRHHDESQGFQLKAYMRVLESQLDLLEVDTQRMYDNNFVETCEPWVLPYIGELVGLDPKAFANLDLAQQRSRVGNALSFARRKGTHAALEKVLSSATGWGVRLVVNQKQLNATQHMAAPMSEGGKLVDLRGGESTWVGSSFEQSSRCVDLRNLTQGSNGAGLGGNQPMNAGIHIWRLKSYYITRAQPLPLTTTIVLNKAWEEVYAPYTDVKKDRETAHALIRAWMDRLESVRQEAKTDAEHFFTASPTGRNVAMFKYPIPWRDHNKVADIGTLPGPLFRNPMEIADEQYRAQIARGDRILDETVKRSTHYAIYLRTPTPNNSHGPGHNKNHFRQIPLEHVLNRSLDPWPDPARLPHRTQKVYRNAEGEMIDFPIEVVVDVNTGRIAFPKAVDPADVRIDYAYGFVSEIGGGTYPRQESLLPSNNIQAYVSRTCTPDPRKGFFNSLQDALAYQPIESSNNGDKNTISGLYSVIRIMDNATYFLPEEVYELTAGRHLVIEADNGRRPCLRGDIALALSSGSTQLSLKGLYIDGSIRVLESAEQCALKLHISHTTLVPKQFPSIQLGFTDQDPALHLEMYHSITGSILVGEDLARLDFQDSIIARNVGLPEHEPLNGCFAIAAFQRCTVLGHVRIRELALAKDTIFYQQIEVIQRKNGQARFCYYPWNSILPSAFECVSNNEARPRFVSTTFGHEAFCQLSQACSKHILQGAEDGGEIGAYHHTEQGRRLAALEQVLDEFLPFGLKAEIRFLS